MNKQLLKILNFNIVKRIKCFSKLKLWKIREFDIHTYKSQSAKLLPQISVLNLQKEKVNSD